MNDVEVGGCCLVAALQPGIFELIKLAFSVNCYKTYTVSLHQHHIESFDDVDKGGGIECKINKANDPVDQVTIIHIANFIFANI